MGANRIFQSLRWVGLLVAAGVGFSGQWDGWIRPGGPIQPLWTITCFLYPITGAIFLINTRDFPVHKRWQTYLLVTQMALSIPLEVSYQLLAAISIPLTTSSQRRIYWLAALFVCVFLNLATPAFIPLTWVPGGFGENHKWSYHLVDIASSLLETYAWMLFAYLGSTLVERMEVDRRYLSSINAELLSSRVMLAESTRLSERLEISRELHDSLGHHLTTLNLELEIAKHAAADQKDDQISKAQFLSRLLLSDLRDAVSSWRDENSQGLPQAIRSLAAGVRGLQITADIDPDLPPIDAGRAHALLRCSQEAVTNAIRHSAAKHVRLQLGVRSPGEIQLEVLDDGQGCPAFKRGSGLLGMAERASEFSGHAVFTSPPAGGFLVRITLPLIGKPA